MTLTPEAWAVLDAWDDELIGRGDVGGEWEAAENTGRLRKMKGTTARPPQIFSYGRAGSELTRIPCGARLRLPGTSC